VVWWISSQRGVGAPLARCVGSTAPVNEPLRPVAYTRSTARPKQLLCPSIASQALSHAARPMVAQSEQVANIHPLPRPGAPGAPPPADSSGGGSTLRPLAAPAPARAYHASQPHHRQAQQLPPLQQLSPQAQLSPSTVKASPSLPPTAPFHRGHVDAAEIPVGEKGRAQIACLTCRRSKTRCVNQGSGSTCKHCEERNKVCQWGESMPVATATGSLRRRESTVGDVDVSALSHHAHHCLLPLFIALLRVRTCTWSSLLYHAQRARSANCVAAASPPRYYCLSRMLD
jgi:hypothetical protein